MLLGCIHFSSTCMHMVCALPSVDHLLPRIRECLEGVAVPQRSDSPTGRELLKLYATDYFTKLSEVLLEAP